MALVVFKAHVEGLPFILCTVQRFWAGRIVVQNKCVFINYYFNFRNVQSLTEIRSDIGYAWAFVRLSLEKKLLSKHLRALLSDKALLRYVISKMYPLYLYRTIIGFHVWSSRIGKYLEVWFGKS